MNPDEQIFNAAATLQGKERAAYLDNACARQPGLKARIEALLRSHEVRGFMEHPADETSPPDVEQSDERIDHYKLLEQIGEGGFGVVWVAEQLEPVRRRVAVKIIKPGMDSREVIARFGQERQALAMMDHPNIAKVFDAGATVKGRPFFVMELVRGVRITEYCDEANLPTTDRLKLFIAVCQAVQHAHQKGIIHRDLKPSNILVALNDDGAPTPKIIDFGVAKAMQPALTDDTVYTQFEQIIGTPAYMSPEQAGLGGLDIDTRSDVYSLGVLLYELLTGRPPFEPKNLLSAGFDEMRRVIREVEPPKPSTRRTQLLAASTTGKHPDKSQILNLKSKIPADLDWIVMKALEKNRNRRYETANSLAADIDRFLDSEPVSARPPGFAYRTGKYIRKHKVPVLAAVAVLVTLLGGLTASTILYLREKAALGRESTLRQRAESGETAALTEASKNAQTSKFLKEILEGLRPEEARGEDRTLLMKMLAKAAQRVGTELKGQPKVEVTLQFTIASVYQTLGAYEKAQAHYERAIEIDELIFGPEHLHTLACRGNLAASLFAQDKTGEALMQTRKVFEISSRVYGPEHPTTLAARANLATALTDDGKHAEAETEYREILKARERIHGPMDPVTLHARSHVAISMNNRGRSLEAEAEHRALLQIRRELLGPDHPDTLESIQRLAAALDSQKKYDEARAEYQKLRELQERIFGPDHPETLVTRYNIAGILRDTGRRTEAESEYREVLRLQESIHGAGFPDKLKTQSELAAMLIELGRFSDAVSEYRKLVEIESGVSGSEHRFTLRWRSGLATALDGLGKYEEAESEFRGIREIKERLLGPEHRETLSTRMSYASALDSRGKYAAAEKEFREILDIQERDLGVEHEDTLRTRVNLSGALYAQAKNSAALEESRKVLSVRERLLGAGHFSALTCRSNIASILDSMGKSAEAEAGHREVLKELSRNLGPDHPSTIMSRHNVAVTQRKQAKHVEAEAAFRDVLAVEERVLGKENPMTLRTIHDLALTLEALGKGVEALEMAETAAKGRRKVLGEGHPDTHSSQTLCTKLKTKPATIPAAPKVGQKAQHPAGGLE